MAVEDDFLRKNPADNMMKELKQANNLGVEKKKALTRDEEKLFLNFLEESHQYHHWKPIFEVMLGSGLRVGEVTGLRWEDLDFENGFISVNHTLVYYQHAENGCYFGINTPKTKAGIREVPMLSSVREAFWAEKEYQEAMEITCKAKIDGYTNFVFVNRFGNVQHQGTLNKALRRIMRDCNEQILEKSPNAKNLVLLPRFSCHILRHTFATRLYEEGVNMKVIQDVLGHSDIGTTMNIYADATRELKTKELGMLEDYFSRKADEDTDAGEEKEKREMVIDVVQINK